MAPNPCSPGQSHRRFRPGDGISAAVVMLLLLGAWSMATDIELQLTYRRPTVEPRGEYHVVTLPDLPLSGSPGTPLLPVETVQVVLPPGCTDAEIQATPISTRFLPGQFRIQPSGSFLPIGKPIPADYRVTADATLYSRTTPFPATIAGASRVDVFRGFPILTVTIHPVRYIPAQGRLLYSSDIRLTITPQPGVKRTTETFRGTPGDLDALRRKVRNSDLVKAFHPGTSRTKDAAPVLGDSGPYDYIVITGAALDADFQELVKHKINRGLRARSVTVEEIYPHYAGRDNPERIRNFIRDAYLNWGIDYVLLGGDTEVIPVRLAYGRVEDPVEGVIEDSVPCDLYYACLDGDWDANGNSVFGEPSEHPDLVAEIYIGRAPVEPDDFEYEIPWYQVANFTNKVITYENDFDAPYHKRVLLVGEKLWDDPLSWGGDYKDAIATMIPSSYEVTKYYDRDGTFNSNGELVVEAINNGVHLINHMGHADTWLVAWLAEYEFYDITGDEADVSNTSDFCFFYSQGCYAGAFDESGGLFALTDECVGENLVASAHGAFAVIMNSRYGFFEPADLAASPSQQFDEQFWDAVFNEGITRLGEANQDSKEDNLGLLAADTTGAYLWCYYNLNLLGDPETRLGGSVSRQGRIAMDRPAYREGDTVEITIMDMDLNENRDSEDTVTIPITCSGGDSEWLQLQEVGISTGVFKGTLTLSAGAAAPGNGRLECQDGDTITAAYIDTDDGNGEEATRGAQATADFTPPDIHTIQVVNITDHSATITWRTNEECSGTVIYGTAETVTSQAVAPAFRTAQSVTLDNLKAGATYSFSIRVTDLAGHTTLDDNDGNDHLFSTLPGITLLREDAESGTGEWEVMYAAADNPGNTWYITENFAYSGTHSWHYCNESWDDLTEQWIFNYPTAVYPAHGYLVSPEIDLQEHTAARLQFWYLLSIGGNAGNTWDYANVEINRGAGWEILQEMTDTNGVWEKCSISLDPHVGNVIRIRFDFYCDWDVLADIYPGWFLDEIMVIAPLAHAPTDITLSNNTVAENQPPGTLVGLLSTTHENEDQTFSYSVVAGDVDSFTIDGDQLRTARSFDYEARRLYSIRVQTEDTNAATHQKSFIVSITNVNEAPTDITLSNSSVPENEPPGTPVGIFSTIDPDDGQTFTYMLVEGTDGDHNDMFTVDGDLLLTAKSFDFEQHEAFSIRVRTDDGHGGIYEKTFVIAVIDVNEPPGTLQFTAATYTVSENDGSVRLYVSRINGSYGPASLTFSTTDATADAGSDYTAATGTLVWSDGDAESKYIDILIVDDHQYEGSETFRVTLAVADADGATLGTPSSATVTILDDEAAPVIHQGNALYATMDEDGHPAPWTPPPLSASDADGDTLTWSLLSDPSHGSAAVSGAGTSPTTFDYAPTPDWNGDDQFVVQVSDGHGGDATVTVHVTVAPRNDPPVNTTPPAVTGIHRVGTTLSATTGVWHDDIDQTPGTLSYSYQWRRADDEAGSGAEPIDGRNGPSYELQTADAEKYVCVDVTATDDGEGQPASQSTSASSPWTYVQRARSSAPTAVNLLAASDTGLSDSDNITRNNNATADTILAFAIEGTSPNAIVRLFAEGTEIGSATAVKGTTIVETVPGTTLADDTYAFTATQTEPDKTESPPSPQRAVTVDTVPPYAVETGSPDTAFATAGSAVTAVTSGPDQARDLLIQPDGGIVVVGQGHVGASQVFALTRFQRDGTRDTTFGSEGSVHTSIAALDADAACVALQTNGRIVVAGRAKSASGDDDIAVVRYHTDGALDRTFGSDGVAVIDIAGNDDDAQAVGIRADGCILVAGASHNGTDWDLALLLLDPRGRPVEAFGHRGLVMTGLLDGADEKIYGMALCPDGSALLAGYAGNGAGSDMLLVRCLPDGRLDADFGSGGIVRTDGGAHEEGLRGIALLDNGDIVVAGWTHNGTDRDLLIARYKRHGALDTAFAAEGIMVRDVAAADDLLYGVAVQTDGRIVACGQTALDGADRFMVLRCDAAGTLDSSFADNGLYTTTAGLPGGPNAARAIAIAGDGSILAAGTAYDGHMARFGTLCLHGDGAPPAPDLQTACDSGVSDSDNVTNDATPRLDIAASPYWRLYERDVRISADFETGAVAYLNSLEDGTYAITVAAVDAAGNESAQSQALILTIDTTPPVLTGAVSRKLHGASATFDLPLPIDSPWGIECRYGDTLELLLTFDDVVRADSPVDATITAGIGTLEAAGFLWNTLDCRLSAVAEAQWLSLNLQAIEDIAGNTMTQDFTVGVLAGDVDLNGVVDAQDILSVRQFSLQPVDKGHNYIYDTDGSGVVDARDILFVRYFAPRLLP